jgi:hypothetical protein
MAAVHRPLRQPAWSRLGQQNASARLQATGVTVAQPTEKAEGGIRIAPLLALALVVLLFCAGCNRQAAPSPSPAHSATGPGGPLQEVLPPGAVLQIDAALAGHRPRVTILSPSEGAVVPAGGWTLSLALDDWPLARHPSLGLGPHLVVQVDDGPRQRIGDWQHGNVASGRLDLAMPELAPGSHRIQVYAAKPWGESVKLPGGSAERLVHRVAANPLGQPVPGSPQLVAVSPDGLSQSEPVLIDWLLRDAPLQGLREGDDRWNLRITVNGDSFLVDQTTSVWLRGFRQGSNALLLDLLDGLGEPLNPPFNSLVREVVITPGAARPLWLNDHLSSDDLAQLLEGAPVSTATSSPPAEATTAEADAPSPSETEAPMARSEPPLEDPATSPTEDHVGMEDHVGDDGGSPDSSAADNSENPKFESPPAPEPRPGPGRGSGLLEEGPPQADDAEPLQASVGTPERAKELRS